MHIRSFKKHRGGIIISGTSSTRLPARPTTPYRVVPEQRAEAVDARGGVDDGLLTDECDEDETENFVADVEVEIEIPGVLKQKIDVSERRRHENQHFIQDHRRQRHAKMVLKELEADLLAPVPKIIDLPQLTRGLHHLRDHLDDHQHLRHCKNQRDSQQLILRLAHDNKRDDNERQRRAGGGGRAQAHECGEHDAERYEEEDDEDFGKVEGPGRGGLVEGAVAGGRAPAEEYDAGVGGEVCEESLVDGGVDEVVEFVRGAFCVLSHVVVVEAADDGGPRNDPQGGEDEEDDGPFLLRGAEVPVHAVELYEKDDGHEDAEDDLYADHADLVDVVCRAEGEGVAGLHERAGVLVQDGAARLVGGPGQ
mmetsp:Transcript_10598/g.27804  ORF Transcript_10598/g.27804 Transcript_10598/m.27804 type:complete len:365 (+) Transcript_10598:1164-2258(+)